MNIDINNLRKKVLDSVSISSVIGHYIDIQKKGTDYRCVCPFHNDSTPSMNISESKKIFKCFSCDTSGNAITFLTQFKNISQIDAIREIIQNENIDIKLDGINLQNNKEFIIKKINNSANDVFKAILFTKQGREALNYLKNTRKLSYDIIEYFDIGFCCDKDFLLEYLQKENFQLKDIETSNLITYYNNKKYNFFADRIVFPIKDIENNTIGFSGRILSDDKTKSKYINSKEGIIFKKSELLYNIFNAKKYIIDSRNVFILEGFMDVIALHRIGIKNAIAIMGTNISDFQIKQLSSLNSPTFTIFLDGDDAGVSATMKIIKKLLQNNKKINIIVNDTENDPDELLNKGDDKYLKAITSKPISIITFLIKKVLVDLKQEEIADKLKDIFDVICHDYSEINQVSYIQELATNLEKFNLNFDIINRELNKYKKSNNIVSNKETINSVYTKSNTTNNQPSIYDEDFPEFVNFEEELSPLRFRDVNKKIIISQTKRMFLKSIAYCFLNKSMFKLVSYDNVIATIASYDENLIKMLLILKKINDNSKDLSLSYAIKLWNNEIKSSDIILNYINSIEKMLKLYINSGADISEVNIDNLIKHIENYVEIINYKK
ncbi:DNA primase [Spiroplasma endosymbiont of Aspidapion aeneum]|uniref:DNA primase n=1 Tax=Spiroplasma endosymbiont of Aspidapion aeneum TaxID=3066276 RepID=UPI00313CF1D3